MGWNHTAAILEAYVGELAALMVAVSAVLAVSVVYNVRAKNKLKLHIQRHEILSRLSNEYLFTFHTKTKDLELSERCSQLFGPECRDEALAILKDALSECGGGCPNHIIRLPLTGERTGVFKVISSAVSDLYGQGDYIIGKLVDYSAEAAEREELLVRSQTDGLTCLYNAETTQQLIQERLRTQPEGELDALILVDCDDFKLVNDTFGHLVGNQVLEKVGAVFRQAFRSSDILGRIGGDEFAVYLLDIPSAEFVREKCQRVIESIAQAVEDTGVSFSAGVAVVRPGQCFQVIFQHADDALYAAKRRGKAQVMVFDGERRQE